MALSDEVSIKYGVFTLCSRTLLEHLNEFNKLPRDTRLSWQKLAEHFEQELREVVYQSRPNDLAHGAQILVKGLDARREAIATFNPDAADIVGKMMATIEHEAPTWQYKADIEKHRQHGETLARLFYEGTPWPRTQERLTTEAHVVFEYAGLLHPATQGQNTYGYRVAPMAYHEYDGAEPDEPQENVIVLRFDFQHSFSTYLAYPFFFLHEYISHVYGANSDSDIFDDGWMMYAAHSFLERIHYSLPVAHLLKDAQMQAINEHCPGKLSEYPRDYYFLAQNLYSRLPVQLQQRFRQMTWELAGYPLSAENPSFHAGFVERIRYHFETRPDELMRKLAEYTNVDALFMRLPPP